MRIFWVCMLMVFLIAVQGLAGEGRDYFVSAAQVKKQIQSGPKPFLIDIRHASAFEKYRIPGSINLPLYAVKTKRIFQTGAVVLLNEGYQNTLLIKECRNLKEKGYTVSILHGGLNAWHRSGGRIDGDVFELANVNLMPARAWFSEQKSKRWIIVDVSKAQTQNAGTPLTGAVHVPYLDNRDDFSDRISELLESGKGSSSRLLMIFNTEGTGYREINKALSRVPVLFFLEGGMTGYKKFLENQALIRNRDKKQVGTRKCNTCG